MKISGILDSKHRSDSLTRLMSSYIKEVYEKTNISHKTLELTGSKLNTVDF